MYIGSAVFPDTTHTLIGWFIQLTKKLQATFAQTVTSGGNSALLPAARVSKVLEENFKEEQNKLLMGF